MAVRKDGPGPAAQRCSVAAGLPSCRLPIRAMRISMSITTRNTTRVKTHLAPGDDVRFTQL